MGSQGFPLQRRRTFLAEESELSALVTKCIEEREQEVFTLQIEAETVHQRCVRLYYIFAYIFYYILSYRLFGWSMVITHIILQYPTISLAYNNQHKLLLLLLLLLLLPVDISSPRVETQTSMSRLSWQTWSRRLVCSTIRGVDREGGCAHWHCDS